MRIDGSSYLPELASRAPVSRPEGRQPAQSADLKTTLTSEEINYFAELEKFGPVTYGRRGAKVDSTPAPAALGQRIDIRA